MDALHLLADQHGVRCVNGPRALERTIDKSWAGALLAAAGVPTPPTIVCERRDDAMARVRAARRRRRRQAAVRRDGQRDRARRRPRRRAPGVRARWSWSAPSTTCSARSPAAGRRDCARWSSRGEVAGAMERVSDSWRANVARGGRPRAVTLTEAGARHGAGRGRGGRRPTSPASTCSSAPTARSSCPRSTGSPAGRRCSRSASEDLTRGRREACEALVSDVTRHLRQVTAAGPQSIRQGVAVVRAVIAPSCSAVATSAPAAPARASASRSSSLRTPPPA